MFSAFLHPVSILYSAFICITMVNALQRKPPYLHSQHYKYTKYQQLCQENLVIWWVFSLNFKVRISNTDFMIPRRTICSLNYFLGV
jgi:hypothetical protein